MTANSTTASRLVKLEDDLWIVDGTMKMPPGPLPRRMTIARFEDQRLAVFSAIALDETGWRQVESIGEPAVLIVPNAFHRTDAPVWKARYPQMHVVAPAGARNAVEKVVTLDATDWQSADASVQFVTVPGTRKGEGALPVHGERGTTLVVNDLIGNVQNARGLMKLVLWVMGFAGRRPQVPRMFARRMIDDRAAVADQFERWADMPRLTRIIVSHGMIIEREPANVLRRLARELR